MDGCRLLEVLCVCGQAGRLGAEGKTGGPAGELFTRPKRSEPVEVEAQAFGQNDLSGDPQPRGLGEKDCI